MSLNRHITPLLFAFLLVGITTNVLAAQTDKPAGEAVPTAPAKPSTAGPPPLVIFFKSGSSTLRADDKAVLDRASRAYNEGKPIVMIITGSTDRVGGAQANLTLSERRAIAVLHGLLDRGIPADRFQVLAKGETELPVPTNQGVADAQNRRVEITWH